MVVVVLWLAAGVVTCLTTTVSVRHRASAAADAAALAGALDGDLAPGSACAAARAMAGADGAAVVHCESKDGVVAVTAVVAAPAWMRWAGAGRGTARAGPVAIPGELTASRTAS